MRLFVLLALFVIACASRPPVAPVAPADINPDDLPEQQNGLRLPCSWSVDLCIIPAKLNDSTSVRLVVDTGSSLSVLNASLAKQLGLAPVAQGAAAGSGNGSSEAYQLYQNLRLSVDELDLKNQTMIGLPFDYVRKRTHQKVDGTLGANVLKNYVVEFNYERGDVVLYRPPTWLPDPAYESLPLEFEGDVPVVRASVNGVEGRFIIDAGQILAALIVTPSFVEKHPEAVVSIKERKEKPVEAVGGRIDFVSGNIERFALGRLDTHNVKAAFVKSSRGIYARADIAGALGPKLFAHTDLVIDYAHKIIYFKRW